MMILKIRNDIGESAFFGGDDRPLWDHGYWLDTNKQEDFQPGWTGIFVIEAEGVTHTYILEDWWGFAKELGIDTLFTPRCSLIDTQELKLKNLKIGHDFFAEATVLEMGEV